MKKNTSLTILQTKILAGLMQNSEGIDGIAARHGIAFDTASNAAQSLVRQKLVENLNGVFALTKKGTEFLKSRPGFPDILQFFQDTNT